MKTRLEIGDVVFQLRNHSATARLEIDRVTDQLAYSGDFMFVRSEVDPIRRVTALTGYSKIFGESFVFETPENKEHHIKEIRLRFIRNFEYSKLDNEQISKLENLLELFMKKQESRCCGRCDGVNDLCVSEQVCKNHEITGCEICFGKR